VVAFVALRALLFGAAAALLSAAPCFRARVAIVFSYFALRASSSVSWPVLGSIGMWGRGLLALYWCAALHSFACTFASAHRHSFDFVLFASTLSFLLRLLLLFPEALLLPSRL
jgi:hypothetical protein